MRELKFRAWDRKNEKMINVARIDISDGSLREFLFEGEFLDYLNNEILMQYVGLKDKNNIEIYEGDIVDISNGEIFIVDWHKYNQEFTFSKNGHYYPKTYRGATRDDWEVVGNIYENKELFLNI